MNEITREVKTGNSKLNTAIKKIDKELENGRKSGLEICRQLAKIKTEELYTAVSDSFSEFCETWWKLSKSQGSRLANVGERFLLTSEDYNEYSSSQLVEMLKATDEQLTEIKPTMTVKQIRDLINPPKTIEDKSKDSDESNDTNESDDTNESNDTADSNTVDIDDGFVTAKNADGTRSVNIYSIQGLINFAKFAKENNIMINNENSIEFDI